MNMDEMITELNRHGYNCYEYSEEDCNSKFYIEIEKRSLLSNHQITLLCETTDIGDINVICGDEIAYGSWYDLWREELDKYRDELNEEIKLKAGIWFEN